jgi:hypothetical protein
MSTLTAEFDTGEIPRPVGERTLNLAPFVIGPPAFRRPDATGEIPEAHVTAVIYIGSHRLADQGTAPDGYRPRHRRPGWLARLAARLRRPEPVGVYDRLGALFGEDPDSTVSFELPMAITA